MTDWRLSETSYFIWVTHRSSKNCDFIPFGPSSKFLLGFVILLTKFLNDQVDAIHQRRTLNWAPKRRESNYQVRNARVTLALVRIHIHSLDLNTDRFWWKLFAHARVCFSNSRLWEPWWQCHVCEGQMAVGFIFQSKWLTLLLLDSSNVFARLCAIGHVSIREFTLHLRRRGLVTNGWTTNVKFYHAGKHVERNLLEFSGSRVDDRSGCKTRLWPLFNLKVLCVKMFEGSLVFKKASLTECFVFRALSGRLP